MRKHNYVVGYRGEGQCVYGERDEEIHYSNWTGPLTLMEAKIRVGELRNKGAVVYKLVEVKNA